MAYQNIGDSSISLNVAKFEIPCGIDGQYINTTQSYLMFSVVNKDPNNVPFYPDLTAESFISKIEVYSSSQLVKEISFS